MTTRETTRTDDRGEERRSRGPEEKYPSANSFASSSRDGAFDVTSRKLMNHRNLNRKRTVSLAPTFKSSGPRRAVARVRSATSRRASVGTSARHGARPRFLVLRRGGEVRAQPSPGQHGAQVRARSLGVDATRAIDVGKQTGSPLAVPARGRLNLSDRRDPLAPLAPSRPPPPPDPQARDPARCGGG